MVSATNGLKYLKPSFGNSKLKCKRYMVVSVLSDDNFKTLCLCMLHECKVLISYAVIMIRLFKWENLQKRGASQQYLRSVSCLPSAILTLNLVTKLMDNVFTGVYYQLGDLVDWPAGCVSDYFKRNSQAMAMMLIIMYCRL